MSDPTPPLAADTLDGVVGRDTPITDRAARTIRAWIANAPLGETRALTEPVPAELARSMERKLREAQACLREACECYEADADRVEAHIRGPDPFARWRRVAGLDTANKSVTVAAPAAGDA